MTRKKRVLGWLMGACLLALPLAACGDEEVGAGPDAPDASGDARGATADGGGSDPDAAPIRDGGRRDADAAGDDVSLGTLTILAGSTATGFADGVGTDARFSGPSGGIVLPDGSAIFVADTFNAVIRRIDLATRAVTTIAGKVQVQATADGVGLDARFQSPRAMTVAPDGSALFVADGPTIRKIALPTYAVTTIAGTAGQAGFADGTGAAVRLGFLLHALEISEDGSTLYVADRSNKCIRTVALASGAVTTVAGVPYTGANQHVNGAGGVARFSGVGGIVRLGSELFVADTFNHVVRKVTIGTWEVSTIAGQPGTSGIVDGDPATARFATPQGLVAKGGHLYSTSFDGVLRRISLADFAVETILGTASDARSVDGTGADARLGLAFAQPMPDPSQNVLWYQDRSASSIRKIDLTASSVLTFAGAKEPEAHVDGPFGAARFVGPDGLASDADGSVVFVSDSVTSTIRRIDVGTQTVTTIAGAPNETGTDDGPAATARFDGPSALAWDGAGQRLFVADTGNHVVRVVDLASSSVSTLVGAGGTAGSTDGALAEARLASPVGLAFDAASNKLYVSESASSTAFPGGRAAIRVVDLATSVVGTLAGGAPASPPADGAASGATFATPRAIALDAAGKRLFVAESGRSTVRVVDLAAMTVATLAGKDGESGPGDGAFADARFEYPSGLAWSAGQKVLFVSDGSSHTIRRLDLTNGKVSTWLGDPSRNGGIAPGVVRVFEDATLYSPGSPVIAGGGLLFSSEHAVYRASPAAAIAP